MPTNPTGMSVAVVTKWLLVIMAIIPAIQAWQGIVDHQVSPGKYGPLLTGVAAIGYGKQQLLVAGLLVAAAGAVWYFWQRNDDYTG